MHLPAHLRIFKSNLIKVLLKFLENHANESDSEWLKKRKGYLKLLEFLHQKPKTFLQYNEDWEKQNEIKRRKRLKGLIRYNPSHACASAPSSPKRFTNEIQSREFKVSDINCLSPDLKFLKQGS